MADNKEPEGSSLAEPEQTLKTPDKSEGDAQMRKSLEGLSPQQDAKVGTLKQMF